jgi:nitrite reductase/ring-hydroxylating ferredoxin subunit
MAQHFKVAKVSELSPGQTRLVRVQGREIALFNVEGTFYAITNACSHSRGPLVEGRVSGTTVTCPWHGAKFDVTNGQCLAEPAQVDVEIYPVYVEDDAIFVDLP